MTRDHGRAFGAALGILLLTACADRPTAESPQVRFEKEAAYRQACAADVLARRAEDDLLVIQNAFPPENATDPVSEISRQAARAALDFARAYQRHAMLRATAYAYLDSAVNHAKTTADSARFVERSASITISTPVPGTLEENVIVKYQEDFSALLADQNHPCNWNFPF
jgi:hypothetical protein